MRFKVFVAGLALTSVTASASTFAFAQSSPGAPNSTPPTAASPPPAPPIIPFDEALQKAANDLFSKANLGDADKVVLVIDPLIDGVTGAQSVATRGMERTIVEIVNKSYPKFQVDKFSTAAIAKSPIVLIGTFTLINNAGQAGGAKDAYRICLALADLKAKKIVSKGVARAKPDGIDTTPTAYFADSPVSAKDPTTDAYIKSCQGTKPGDPIEQVYADRILSGALIADAIVSYDAKRYKDALELYQNAVRTPGGDQLRARNGIYLANWKLKRNEAAADAFGKVIDYGLASNRLAVKFLFRPGSTQISGNSTAPYAMWLKQIAQRGEKADSCLELVGHTSPTGPEPLNKRLSLLRAETIKDRIQAEAPKFAKNMIVNGVGSAENMIGSGKDDASDALDRRVEFKVIAGCGGQGA
jgi:outer membrane protein OmpA-like peptidoglycan-associated protein